MGLDAGRVRRGELIAASGGVLLFAALFLLPCFGVREPAGRLASASAAASAVVASLDGWNSLTTTRWILLVTIAAAVTLVILTASQRAPAVPVTASLFTCLLGILSSLVLLYRVIDHAGLAARAGVYVGLVGALAVGYGGYVSLRTEGSSFGDPRSIEIVPLGPTAPGPAERAGSTSAGRPGS